MTRTYCPGGVLAWVQWASSLRHHRRGAACGGHKHAAVCVDMFRYCMGCQKRCEFVWRLFYLYSVPVHTKASAPAMWPPFPLGTYRIEIHEPTSGLHHCNIFDRANTFCRLKYKRKNNVCFLIISVKQILTQYTFSDALCFFYILCFLLTPYPQRGIFSKFLLSPEAIKFSCLVVEIYVLLVVV